MVLTVLRQNRRLGLLLSGVLLFHVGWYMLLPFLVILLTTRRWLSPAQAGAVLAAQSFAVLLGSLVGGALSDRFGRKLTMVVGLGLRTVGVGALGLATGVLGLLAAAAVAGFGGGCYGPAVKAAISAEAAQEDRTTPFAWRGMAANLGMSAGPLLGAVLVRGPLPLFFGVAAVLHAGLGVATWVMLEAEGPVQEPRQGGWREVLSDSPFVAFSLVTILAWGLFSQLGASLPLYAQRALGLEALVGLLWSLSSVAVVFGQVLVSKYLLARMHPLAAMAWGALLLGAGLGLVGLARSFIGLLGAVLVFVAGEMLLLPTADSTVSTMARPAIIGSYFGFASFGWGLGEGVGNLVGGALLQYAFRTGQPGLPWVIYALVGLLTAGLYLLLRDLPQAVPEALTEDVKMLPSFIDVQQWQRGAFEGEPEHVPGLPDDAG